MTLYGGNRKLRDFQKERRGILRDAWPEVSQLMRERVAPWQEHFISYSSHPRIDDYFDQLALSKIASMPGPDAFPAAAPFGGVGFAHYVGAVGLLVSWTLKHMAFATELLNQRVEIRSRNVATIFATCEELVSDMAAVLGIDRTAVARIVDAITLKAKRTKSMCAFPGVPPPPLIQVSHNQLFKSVCGCLRTPFVFLLDSLRTHYRSDWDRAVDSREDVFREELYAMFPQSHMFRSQRRVRLRTGGQDVTDIDAALVNRVWGSVALFQIKWQDLFGASMRQRESQKRNLLSTGNRWVDRVCDWIESNSLEALARQLGLTKSESQGIRQVRLFVLGRNASHFSGEGEPDSRAAWGNWRQVQRLVAENYDGTGSD